MGESKIVHFLECILLSYFYSSYATENILQTLNGIQYLSFHKTLLFLNNHHTSQANCQYLNLQNIVVELSLSFDIKQVFLINKAYNN